MSSKQRGGFTLVEVIVALAVAATALILLLAANRDALQRSVRARQSGKLEQAIESKLDELASGVETAGIGQLSGFPTAAWQSAWEQAEFTDVPHMQKLTLQITLSDTQKMMSRTILVYRPEVQP